jgi:hypothetical protein
MVRQYIKWATRRLTWLHDFRSMRRSTTDLDEILVREATLLNSGGTTTSLRGVIRRHTINLSLRHMTRTHPPGLRGTPRKRRRWRHRRLARRVMRNRTSIDGSHHTRITARVHLTTLSLKDTTSRVHVGRSLRGHVSRSLRGATNGRTGTL